MSDSTIERSGLSLPRLLPDQADTKVGKTFDYVVCPICGSIRDHNDLHFFFWIVQFQLILNCPADHSSLVVRCNDYGNPGMILGLANRLSVYRSDDPEQNRISKIDVNDH